MNLYDFLEQHKTDTINEATGLLTDAHLKSYLKSGEVENKKRLEDLYTLTMKCVKEKSLLPMTKHGEKIATQRFESGFDLHEVHTAFNVLEEEIWKDIMRNLPAEQLGESLGMVSTILGAGKEVLALTYVALASKSKTKTLNLSELFEGN